MQGTWSRVRPGVWVYEVKGVRLPARRVAPGNAWVITIGGVEETYRTARHAGEAYDRLMASYQTFPQFPQSA